RILNETPHVVPAYWWSNIAVPAYEGSRVIMDAEDAYSQPGGYVHKNKLPMRNGKDITYPANSAGAFDYFWNIPAKSRKFITHVDAQGYGLLQCSTSRMRGRKLFVWGQQKGSERWQEFLSDGTKNGKYYEIQAGLAKTQYECVPMSPFTTWEWVEAYGALSIPQKDAHGDWQTAKTAACQFVNNTLPEDEMEALLTATHDTIAIQKANEMVTYGSGWGALENERRRIQGQPLMAKHLDFGEMHSQQKYWLDFLKNGSFAEQTFIPSYMRQVEWTDLLLKSANSSGEWNWQVHTHLGFIALCENRLKDAASYLRASLALHQSSEALFGLSVVATLNEDAEKSADFAVQAAALVTENDHYAKHAIKQLFLADENTRLLAYMDEHKTLWQNGRCRMYAACALIHTGEVEKANNLINENGGLVVADLRENETAITELWLNLEKAKAENGGGKSTIPPDFFEFRTQECDD
ncbi:MAG: DUF5107 domain-containing protein, partial [Oscillospiraceae bacterium]